MRSCKILLMSFLLTAFFAVSALAAFDKTTENAYNLAVQGQNALEGMSVVVDEETVSASTNNVSTKRVTMTVSGIGSVLFAADIKVEADETSSQSYYRNGYYYETVPSGNIKSEMDRSQIWKAINSQVYLDMTSNYLVFLNAKQLNDGSTGYSFAATEQSIGDYKEKLLDSYTAEQGATIISLQGTMTVSADGRVLTRYIDMIYTVGEGDNQETFLKKANAVFGEEDNVTVSLPDLTSYVETKPEKPAVTITAVSSTLYTTTDVNVRSAGSLDASIIGGYSQGSGVAQTGYTSDGWIQIQYGDSVGYIWGELTTRVKPVITSASSGTMYASVDANVREGYGTEHAVLGVLSKGSSIEVTGTTDNGWTRVKYKGLTGYISSNLLTWTKPVTAAYVNTGSVSGTILDASYGTLTLYTDGGNTVMFNTCYASFSLNDSLETGDYVTVSYTGTGSPYTATSVKDHSSHGSSYSSGSSQTTYYEENGVVCSYSKNTIEVACDDGSYRSYNIGGASVEVDGGLSVGDYVTVAWYSDSDSKTKNLNAISVS